MKKISLFLLATLAVFSSCSDNNEPTPAFAEMVTVQGGTTTLR